METASSISSPTLRKRWRKLSVRPSWASSAMGLLPSTGSSLGRPQKRSSIKLNSRGIRWGETGHPKIRRMTGLWLQYAVPPWIGPTEFQVLRCRWWMKMVKQTAGKTVCITKKLPVPTSVQNLPFHRRRIGRLRRRRRIMLLGIRYSLQSLPCLASVWRKHWKRDSRLLLPNVLSIMVSWFRRLEFCSILWWLFSTFLFPASPPYFSSFWPLCLFIIQDTPETNHISKKCRIFT